MDWQGLLQVGLVQLRLSPAEFWALTPAELQIKLGLEHRGSPMGRDQLDALARAFPDMNKDPNDG